MGSRIDIDTFPALTKVAFNALLDGVISGEPFAKTIKGFLASASAFGADYADTHAEAKWSRYHRVEQDGVEVEDFDVLKRLVVGLAFDALMGSGGITAVATLIAEHGALFGFVKQRRKIDERANANAGVEAALAAATAEQEATGNLSTETSEKLCGEILTVSLSSPEIGSSYMREALVNRKLKIDGRGTNMRAITRIYAQLIV